MTTTKTLRNPFLKILRSRDDIHLPIAGFAGLWLLLSWRWELQQPWVDCEYRGVSQMYQPLISKVTLLTVLGFTWIKSREAKVTIV